MKKTVLDYLEETTKRFPNNIAFLDRERKYTFQELSECAKRIATNIAYKGIYNAPVVIYMKKSADCIAAMMGVLYSGCYYSPIDENMPSSRLKCICDTLEPQMVICDDSTMDSAQNCVGKKCCCEMFRNLVISNHIADNLLADIRRKLCKSDLMYVLFTSGSTGVPKGVSISHRAVVDFGEWICEEYSFGNDIKLCNQSPFYFDASLPDLIIPIMSGGTLYIPPQSLYVFPKNILKYIIDNSINTLIWVPSALKIVVDCHAFDVYTPCSIRTIIFCGEVLPVKYLKKWMDVVSDARYVNMYGPTETTYACTYYEIQNVDALGDSIPLGFPCENCNILLLDDNNHMVDDGDVGEICVKGDCLFIGYYRDFIKTDESILYYSQNGICRERVYKTGDLGYLNEQGLLFYVGRKDHQIKKMGYRIELGEIENAIMSLEEISGVCCMYDSKNVQIIAVYSGSLEIDDIKMELRNKIPQYMIPDVIHKVLQIPLNINGKVDRTRLQKEYIKED